MSETLYDKLKGPGPDLSGYREARSLSETEQQFLKVFFSSVSKEAGCFVYVFYFIIVVLLGGAGCTLFLKRASGWVHL